MMKLLSFLVSRTNYTIDIIAAHLHDFRIEDTIVISGTPRSGSTWFMELMESLPGYRSVFEPFHHQWYPGFKKLSIPPDPYVPTPEDYPKLQKYLERVFIGKVYWMFPYKYYLAPGRLLKRLTSNKLLVKFVRANTMLPWIANTFNVRATYFIIRHPCATIASQLATGIYPRRSLERIIREVQKVPELANQDGLIQRLEGISSEVGRLAIVWALENYIPFAAEKPYPWYTVVYERLIREPEEELERVFGYIGEDVPEEIWTKIKKPSMVTRKSYGKEYIGTPKQLLKWKNQLSERQIREILEIVSWFGIDFYRDDPEPDYDALWKWKSPFGEA